MLRPHAAHRRRPLALRDHEAHDRRRHEGLHRDGAEPRRGLRELGDAARGAARSSGLSCATSSRSRPRRSGARATRRAIWREDIGTEVFFLPAAAHVEKDGNFTNTQRVLQWHPRRSSRPATAARSCGSPTTCSRRCASGSPARPTRRTERSSTSPGTTRLHGPARRARRRGGPAGDQRPQGRRVVRAEVPGARRRTARRPAALDPRRHLRGRRQPDRAQEAGHASRTGSRREWGWAWPPTAASSTTARRPTPTATRGRSASVRLVGRRAGQVDGARRRPRLRARQAAGLRAARRTRRGWTRSRGDDPFIIHPDGLGWLYAPAGLVDGPLPTHYEPHESPVAQRALRASSANPTRQRFDRAGQPLQPDRRRARREVFPFVADDLPADRAPHGRRHVAHRALPVRAAARDVLRGLARSSRRSAGSSTAAGRRSSRARTRDRGARAGDRADAAAARRTGATLAPGRPAVPLGRAGARHGRRGERAAAARARPQRAHPEYKAATCDIRPGRRPRGPALRELVEEYRRRAGVSRRSAARSAATAARRAARRLLHRHEHLHRLQGMRGRLQGVEPGPGVDPGFTGDSYDNTIDLGAEHVAPRRVHRAAQPLDAERRRSLVEAARNVASGSTYQTATACAG